MQTKFQKKVFEIVKKIPKGKTRSYKEIAEKLNTSARAVGNALNKNENLIVVPCHRVIKENGKVGGYKLGIEKKIELLKSEGVKIENNKIVLNSKI